MIPRACVVVVCLIIMTEVLYVLFNERKPPRY